MFRIEIKSKGEVTNRAEFSSEQLCLDWYNQFKDSFSPDHSKSIISLFEEQLEAMRLQESTEAINLGMELIVLIRAINRRKLKSGLWTQAKFNELITSPTAANIERSLWNGSLTTAKYLLTNMSSFYSDIEIQKIITKIDAHELKWIELI